MIKTIISVKPKLVQHYMSGQSDNIENSLAFEILGFDILLDENLTAREVELLGYLGQGLPNKVIAEKLKVSENTIKYHIKNILQKLSFSNRSEAAAYAVRHNLTPKL